MIWIAMQLFRHK